MSQELLDNQVSRDVTKLKRLIRSFERSVDDAKLTSEAWAKFDTKFEDIIRPYEAASDFGEDEYLLYEMQALLASEDSAETDAAQYLRRARALMAPEQAFISAAGRKWLEEEIALEDQAAADAPARSAAAAKSDMSRRRKKAALVTAGVIAFLALLNPIADQLTIWGADPAMVSLAKQANMTRQGELLFLQQSPKLVDDSQMVSDCGLSVGNGFTEQGCYLPSSHQIYIRKMPQSFSSLEASTAAYEMLHVAYDNLNQGGQATAFNQAIEANFAAINDQYLNQQVTMFAKAEPGARDDELFSLLATGYSNISPDLSAYVSPYISDTSAVIGYNSQAQQTFTNDENQLTQLKATISTDDKNAQTALYDANSWAYAGNQYEDDRNYNIYVADHNAENAAIDQYNQLLGEYNTLVTEYNGTQPSVQISKRQRPDRLNQLNEASHTSPFSTLLTRVLALGVGGISCRPTTNYSIRIHKLLHLLSTLSVHPLPTLK